MTRSGDACRYADRSRRRRSCSRTTRRARARTETTTASGGAPSRRVASDRRSCWGACRRPTDRGAAAAARWTTRRTSRGSTSIIIRTTTPTTTTSTDHTSSWYFSVMMHEHLWTRQTSLRRSSSDHSIYAARCWARAPAAARLIPITGARAAANQLHVVAAYWLSIDGTDRRTPYRHIYTLSARSGQRQWLLQHKIYRHSDAA